MSEDTKPTVSYLRRPPKRHRFKVKSRLGLHEVPSESDLLETVASSAVSCCGRTIYIAHPITPPMCQEHLLWTCDRCQQPHRITMDAEPGPRELRRPQPITDADIEVSLKRWPKRTGKHPYVSASIHLKGEMGVSDDAMLMNPKEIIRDASEACIHRLEASVFGHVYEKATELNTLFRRYRQLGGLSYSIERYEIEKAIQIAINDLARIGFAKEPEARVIDP